MVQLCAGDPSGQVVRDRAGTMQKGNLKKNSAEGSALTGFPSKIMCFGASGRCFTDFGHSRSERFRVDGDTKLWGS